MLNHQVYPAPGRADAPPGQTVLAGTRRQLTVLCCDVRDVTSLSGSPLDPEDLPAMLLHGG